MTPPKPPVTALTAARRLHDILRWKNQHQPQYQTVQAIRYDRDGRGTTETKLPFPSDSIETDGAQGVETAAGIDTWIELWASWLSWTLDAPTGRADGAWLHKTLEEHRDLNPLPNPNSYDDDPAMKAWATGFLEEWATFTKELTRLWQRLAHTTGNAPLRRAYCPRCKQGWLQSPNTHAGYADEATCTNCKTTIDYSQQEHAASFRAAMRDPNIPATYYLTVEEVKIVWPRIKTGTLSKWVQRGHVRRDQQGRYNLCDINTRRLDNTPKRDTVEP